MLILGDCREIIPTLKFDAIVTDPPEGVENPPWIGYRFLTLGKFYLCKTGQSIDASCLVTTSDGEFMLHWSGKADIKYPVQKPVAVMRFCVGRYTGTILDPYMGTGTTGLACKELGRDFIGIERDPKYFEIARKRLDAR